MLFRIDVRILSMQAVLTVVWFCGSTDVHGSEPLLRHALTAWTDYQQLRLTGTYQRYTASSLVEELTFTANYGTSVNGAPPRYEINLWMDNPGEPHISDPRIVKIAIAETDGIFVNFQREFVTDEPPRERLNFVTLWTRPMLGHDAFLAIRRAIVSGIDGSYFEPKSNFGAVESILQRCQLEELAKEKYLGIDARRVKLTMPADSDSKHSSPLVVESIVATEPTFQVLKYIDVQGGPPGYLDTEPTRGTYLGSDVESVRVMGEWLIRDRVRFTFPGGSAVVRITKVEPLPADYVGLWDYHSLTGALFSGDAEKALRKGSPRKALIHSKEGTFIPYTPEEQEKIRQYVISKTQPIERKIAWSRIALWGINILAVGLLSWIGYRRYRYG